MKYKTIYAAHEARMWLGTIISGIAVVTAITAAHPEMKDAVKKKWSGIKEKIRKKNLKIVVVNEKEES